MKKHWSLLSPPINKEILKMMEEWPDSFDEEKTPQAAPKPKDEQTEETPPEKK